MEKKDLLELTRRFKKDSCTFTKLCGCYVNANKEIVTRINETFLNIKDDEFFKYLEIAKKTLSGNIGDNILSLDIPVEEEEKGGKQHFLMALKESKLKNPDLLERFYEQVIESYDYVGNFLILIYHDAYDVITKTKDNSKIDESEEVYEYLLCAVCPVTLSKPGLGYKDTENRIGARERDWIVQVPEIGILFPAFSDRSSDIHSITYHVKDAKNPHPEFVEKMLGCDPKHTATEKKNILKKIVGKALGSEPKEVEEVMTTVQKNLNDKYDKNDKKDAIPVTKEVIKEVLVDSGIDDTTANTIGNDYEESFAEDVPEVAALVDAKALKKAEEVVEKKELKKQVKELQEELGTVKTYDVVLRVKEEKEKEIKTQVIDGRKYIMIPMDENDNVNINGSKKNI